MRFSELTENLLISSKQNNGDFDYWLCIEVLDWREHDAEAAALHRYTVSLCSVSPSEAGRENIKRAFECCEIKPELANNPIVQVEALKDYGIYATLHSESGNNRRDLIKAIRNVAKQASFLYGFYMDKQQNLIGDSGWDFQKGQLGTKLNLERR